MISADRAAAERGQYGSNGDKTLQIVKTAIELFNRVGYERDRFGRRVHRQLAFGCAIEDILAAIFPNVRSIAAEAAEFDIIDVCGASFLEREDEFVPRPVQ